MSAGSHATLTEKAVAAMREAVAAVVEDHRRRGRPLAVWRDGKVVMEMPGGADGVREAGGGYVAEEKPGPESGDALRQEGIDDIRG